MTLDEMKAVHYDSLSFLYKKYQNAEIFSILGCYTDLYTEIEE